MAKITWVTPAGDLGTYPENVELSFQLEADDPLAPNSDLGFDPRNSLTGNGIPNQVTVEMETDKTRWRIQSLNLPGFASAGAFPNDQNPNRITAQPIDAQYPYRGGRNKVAETFAPLPLGPIGISAIGVVLFGPAADMRVPGPNDTVWQVNANTAETFGEDQYGGHPQPNGMYHYHDTKFINNNAWGNIDQWKNGYRHADGHSKIIGWAADGYPIYGPYGYIDPMVNKTYSVTNNGTGNYVINGASNPILTLVRGFTYRFNVNISGHPFWIKTSPVTGTGQSYNSGVTGNGTQSGTVIFTVPNNAPDTLYYACQIHSTMRGTLNIVDVGLTNTIVRMQSGYTAVASDNRPRPAAVKIPPGRYEYAKVPVAEITGLYPGQRIRGPWPEDKIRIIAVYNNEILLNQVLPTEIRPGVRLSAYWPIGVFVEDYQYTAPQGTSLDPSNGRYCVTPDFPSGTYAYFSTEDINGDPVYPYMVGPNYYGDITPDDTPGVANIEPAPSTLTYTILSGSLPSGIQLRRDGLLYGFPAVTAIDVAIRTTVTTVVTTNTTVVTTTVDGGSSGGGSSGGGSSGGGSSGGGSSGGGGYY